MKRNEKILLGVLAVVLLWAGYILLLEDRPGAVKPAARSTEEYAAVVAKLGAELAKTTLTDLERRRIALASEPFGNKLFYASASQFYFSGGEERNGDAEGLLYSGYLQADHRAYAIINGVEYAVGDEIAEGGYRLTKITPGFVVLERREPSTGRVFKRQVPLVEDDVEDVTLKAVY